MLTILVLSILAYAIPLPSLSELTAIDTHVVGAPEVVRPSKAPLLIKVLTQQGLLKIHNACFIWDCECNCQTSIKQLPFRDGQQIRVWASDERVWQLAAEGKMVLPYEIALGAERAYRHRITKIFGGVFVLSVLLFIWGYLRTRSNRPMQPTAGTGG